MVTPSELAVPGLYLSSRELIGLQRALQVILNVRAYASQDAWRAAALDAVMECLSADMGFFMFRSGDGASSSVSKGISLTAPAEYPSRVALFATRLRLWQRQQDLVVWSRARLWREHLQEMMSSEYYIDFVKPERAFDTIGLTIRTGDDGSLATFHLHHASERGVRFGDRGLALLRLIEPAFRVGVGIAQATPVSLPGIASPRIVSTGSRPSLEVLFPRLTLKERAVVEMLAARRTNREIAEALAVAPGTVKRHVENILQKLGLRSRRGIEPLLDQL